MNDTATKNAFLKLHISILISCFTSIFGRIITLNEGLLVWERLVISFLAFAVIVLIAGKLKKIPVKEFFKIMGAGFLLGLHWLFFYGSIKYSNVSVGIVCFSSVGLFTAIFEPLINKHKFSLREFVYSLITILGIYMIFHFDAQFRTGIILGTISAAIAALYTITNKRVAQNRSSGLVLLYELFGGMIILSCIMPFYLHHFPVQSIFPSLHDLGLLLVLSLFCTIGLYLLQIQALKRISPFTVNLSYNLEPVYTVILAMVFLGEANEVSTAFYIGMGCIVLSVILQTITALRSPSPVRITTNEQT